MVGSLPTTLSWLREGGLKATLHIDNEKDYALGYVHGVIKASFPPFLCRIIDNLKPKRQSRLIRLYLRELLS
jgi:hypothetical protein